MSECDHPRFEEIDQRILETIEMVRCPDCDTLLHPVQDMYQGEVFLVEIPLNREQFANVIDLFHSRNASNSEVDDADSV